MEIGISSATFYPMETERAVDQIIALGFQNVEIFLNSECEFEDSFLNLLKAKLDSSGIRVVSIHPYTSAIEGMYFFTEYPRRVEDGIQFYRKYFRAAERLGAQYFTFHGDRNITGTNRTEIPIERHCEVLSRLAKAAGEYGILVAQENVSWCMSSKPSYIRALRENLGKLIGFTLDLKQAQRTGVPLNEYLDAMGGNLCNIHISDHTETQNCLLPGEGNMDFQDFLGNISRRGYTKSLIIEIYSKNFDDIRQIHSSKLLLDNEILRICSL